VFVAFISPYGKDRNFAKEIHVADQIPFYEAYISASLECCEGRDVKGLYKKARAGEIKNFTGISDPYEAPEHPDLDINTAQLSLDASVNFVIDRMLKDGILYNHNAVKIAQTLYEVPTEAEL
jgi:adenylylsulfate kinase